MTLRILFTLAILAGLAAAPNAQTFRWDRNDIRVRAVVRGSARSEDRAREIATGKRQPRFEPRDR